MRGCPYGVAFSSGTRFRVEIYIDVGDADENERILLGLEASKAAIEAAVGDPLSWELLDGKRACRVALYTQGSIDDPADRLETYRSWAIQKLLRFRDAFPSRVQPLLAGSNGAHGSA